jgi:hypothetical protein
MIASNLCRQLTIIVQKHVLKQRFIAFFYLSIRKLNIYSFFQKKKTDAGKLTYKQRDKRGRVYSDEDEEEPQIRTKNLSRKQYKRIIIDSDDDDNADEEKVDQHLGLGDDEFELSEIDDLENEVESDDEDCTNVPMKKKKNFDNDDYVLEGIGDTTDDEEKENPAEKARQMRHEQIRREIELEMLGSNVDSPSHSDKKSREQKDGMF